MMIEAANMWMFRLSFVLLPTYLMMVRHTKRTDECNKKQDNFLTMFKFSPSQVHLPFIHRCENILQKVFVERKIFEIQPLIL